MGGIRSLRQGAKSLKPFVTAVRGVERTVREGGNIAVLDGEPVTTARLRAIVGADADAPLRDGKGLLLYAAVDGHDTTLAAAVLAGVKRDDRPVLAVVVGDGATRDRIERDLLVHRPLEPSNLAHVTTLDDPAPVLQAVARVLGEGAIAAAQHHPALREVVADTIVARAARQAGTVGAAAILPGSDLPAIALVQVKMVAELAALYGRPLDARRGLEIGGVLIGAFGWRAVARRAVRSSVPVAGFAVRGGIGYSATRAVGQAARTWFSQSGDRADQPLEGLNAAITKALGRRGRR